MVIAVIRVTVSGGGVSDLIEDNTDDVSAKAIERRNDGGNGFALGICRAADNDDSIGGGGHLEALSKAQQRRRIHNHQIVFFSKLVEERREARTDQIGSAV